MDSPTYTMWQTVSLTMCEIGDSYRENPELLWRDYDRNRLRKVLRYLTRRLNRSE